MKQIPEVLFDELRPEPILDKVWPVVNTLRHPKPTITLRRQRATGRYLSMTHEIQLREDSWKKMHLAERRLVVIHEALHAAGHDHGPGYRTAMDTLSHLVYWEVYGYPGWATQNLKKDPERVWDHFEERLLWKTKIEVQP